MAVTMITIVSAPIVIVWVGSHRNGALNLFFSVLLAFAVSVSAGMLTSLREVWIAPACFTVSLLVIGYYFTYVARSSVQPIAFIDYIADMFAHSRRRSSVRADVRRLVKQYKIEVES